MPHYLVQASYTAKTWDNLIQHPEDREASMRRMAGEFGVKLHGFYFAFGEHDAVVIMEAPDHQTMMATLIAAGASGAVSTKTTALITAADAKQAMQQAAKKRDAYRAPGKG